MKTLLHAPLTWIAGALLLLPLLAVAPAPAAAADDGQGRAQAVPRTGSSGSGGSSAGAPSAPSGRASAGSSQGSRQGSRGSVGRTRPSSGDRPSTGRTPVTQRRGGSGSFVPHRPSYYGGHHISYFRFKWGYYGYPYVYGYYPYYDYPRVYWYNYRAYPDLGAVDVDVRPKGTVVYLDGQRIGKVGEFDGFPGYLWLEEGTYDLVFYHEGYETLHEVVTIYPGLVIDLETRMVRGTPTPPEEIVPPPHERSRETYGEGEDPDRRRVVVGTDAARLYFFVEPSNASVYLDGRFLGTADELADLRSGLMVNPGAHELTVLHPSFESESVELEVEPGEELELEVHLKPAG